MNVLPRKIKAYREERSRVRELDAEMQQGLIDSGLLDRASIEAAQQRINNKVANLSADGLRKLHNLPFGLHLHPLPAIDPAYRAVEEPKVLIGGRAGY